MFTRITKPYHLITTLAIVLCGGVLLAYAHFTPSNTAPHKALVPDFPITSQDHEIFASYWTNHILAHGGAASYQYLKEVYGDRDPGRQHDVAHSFSRVLFEIEGLQSIDVCDDDFNHGCFHEILASTIETEGIKVLPELDNFCKTSPYDCQHGIGHGLIALEGYDELSLWTALEHCRNLGSVDIRDGCYGGIFMEYNLRTMEGVHAFSRSYSEFTGDTTCSQVPNYAKRACNFWLAQWFRTQYLGSGLTGLFNWTHAQCLALPERQAQQECVNGLGYEIGAYVHNVDLALSLCNNFLDFTAQCVMSVLAHYNSSLDTRAAAYAACSTQDQIPEEQCTAILNSMAGQRIDLLQS